jgi:carbonic anhydrase
MADVPPPVVEIGTHRRGPGPGTVWEMPHHGGQARMEHHDQSVSIGETMSTADTLLKRNAVRAQPPSEDLLSLSPRLKSLLLVCADHRVDPAHTLGLELGDAVVLRNLGGRITPDIIYSLTILATIAGIEDLSTDVELVIVHHTDCGLSRLTDAAYASLMAGYLGVPDSQVADLRLDDPAEAVRNDIARLRAEPLVPGTLVVSGLVYDVATGQTRLVSPSTRLRDRGPSDGDS